MKARMNVYFEPALLQRVDDLAARKGLTKSTIIEAAVASFLSPDAEDRREAAFTRRLDRLTRQVERLERDLTISTEAVALFVRFWLSVTPPLPESASGCEGQGQRTPPGIRGDARTTTRQGTELSSRSVRRHNLALNRYRCERFGTRPGSRQMIEDTRYFAVRLFFFARTLRPIDRCCTDPYVCLSNHPQRWIARGGRGERGNGRGIQDGSDLPSSAILGALPVRKNVTA